MAANRSPGAEHQLDRVPCIKAGRCALEQDFRAQIVGINLGRVLLLLQCFLEFSVPNPITLGGYEHMTALKLSSTGLQINKPAEVRFWVAAPVEGPHQIIGRGTAEC